MNNSIYYKQSLNMGMCPSNIAIVKVEDDKITFVNCNGKERIVATSSRYESENILKCFFNRGSGHARLVALDVC